MANHTVSSLHFSPRPNRAHEINWREWGEDAFREARESGKPVLLSISAVWCHWCHVMDETTYSDEGVIAFINERYIPVRVDNDQRPDINARYNMGGWPTTAFLTPDGEILAGATYVPPDQMKEALPRVYTHFVSNHDEVVAKAAELREARAVPYAEHRGDVTPKVFDDVVKSVANNYDPLYGGFGEAPKFPQTDAIDLLLYAHRRRNDPDLLHMARKTLESMHAGEVYDREWDGFFRYATRRDWSEPHYEKMLEDNAGLLRNALALYRITNDAEHAHIAEGIVRYVEWKLRDHERGCFYGSQDADEEFYRLARHYREGREEPYIDRTCYTAWNARMISAYIEASWTLDRPDLLEAALKALGFLWEYLRDPERGMYRYHDGAPHIPGLLADQAYMGCALLDAAQVTGDNRHSDRAAWLAGLLEARFRDTDNGGFWDVWDEVPDVGRLADRQKSVQDNAVCAELFLRLAHLTRKERYHKTAQSTLEAFVGVYPRMGYFAAGYGKWCDIFLNPPAVVNIVGKPDEVAGLHKAALFLEAPFRAIQVLDPERDGARLESLFLPPQPSPAAYACLGTACSAPVTSPAELAAAVKSIAETPAGGFTLEL